MQTKPHLKSIKIGLGCMPLSGCYGATAESHAVNVIQKAYDLGVCYFDTADNYGDHKNEEILGKAIKTFKNHVFISSKIGVKKSDDKMMIVGSSKYIKQACEASLTRLNIDSIDLLFYHHLDKSIAIEETIEAMSELVKEGKVKHLGLFEMELDILKRAHAIHPLSAYQAEYSLISRGVEKHILPFCQKHDIRFIANAPLARGLLTDHAADLIHLNNGDLRSLFPRFQQDNLSMNIEAILKLQAFAKGCNMSIQQLCLTWLLTKNVSPIFGTTNLKHLEEDFKSLSFSLTDQDLEKLNDLLLSIEICGARLPKSAQDLYLDL